MNITWKERVLAQPGQWGSCLGMVLLAITQCLALIVLTFITPDSPTLADILEEITRGNPAILVILLTPCIPAMFWGAILGSSAVRGWHHWVHNRNDMARQTLRRTGVWCSIINGLWLLLGGPFILFLFGGYWAGAAYEFLTKISLQASLLVLLASFLLPRHEENTVQVTETLRL